MQRIPRKLIQPLHCVNKDAINPTTMLKFQLVFPIIALLIFGILVVSEKNQLAANMPHMLKSADSEDRSCADNLLSKGWIPNYLKSAIEMPIEACVDEMMLIQSPKVPNQYSAAMTH